MGHGDHWAAIGKSDEEIVEEMLPVICKQGKLIGENAFSHTLEDVSNKSGTVHGLRYLDTPLHFLGLVVSGIEEGHQLWSAYPVCAEAIQSRLVIEAIEPDDTGIQGVVEASVPERGIIRFFDPYFFRDKDLYRVGEESAVNLAALAYMFRKAEQMEIQVDGGPMLEIHRQNLLEEDPTLDVNTITSVPISMEGAAFYFPHGDAKDDAELRFVIEHLVPFECAGRRLMQVTGAIMKPDSGDVKIHVYVAEQLLDGYKPQVGDNVEAIVWMQGYLSPLEKG